jgi:hypothetical protein
MHRVPSNPSRSHAMPFNLTAAHSALKSLRRASLFSALLLLAVSARAWDAGYETTLHKLCDALISTQITDPNSPDFGALVCPSVNPQEHPLHSRTGEAVYPLAIAYQKTRDTRYRDSAIRLARWLISIQQPRGAWGEDSPNHDGWAGTTSDQLFSLAGAWPILRNELTPADQALWENAMRQASEHVVKTFPISNVNYQPTGAVALLLASQAVKNPPDAWLAKAESLIALTVEGITADRLLTGEGMGVDGGYNMAQSIGYLALWGILKSDAGIRQRAADLLRAHLPFVYPNGSIDNSWGTRSYKWTYESGTKTAPGVYFTFTALADQDPSFGPAGRLCLEFLQTQLSLDGFVTTGPHAHEHGSTNPSCLYSTFTRAQSLAMAIEYARPDAQSVAPALIPAQQNQAPKVYFYPTINVAVVRTKKLMATVSAYGAIQRYGRGQVSRGGSLTNLWIDGFSRDGFAQTSSVAVYKREEKIHMPDEPALRPLTPQIECEIEGETFTNLFEDQASMSVAQKADHIEVTTHGSLRNAAGQSAEINYTLIHYLYDEYLTKEFVIRSPRKHTIRLTEPFVKMPGLNVTQPSPRSIRLAPPAGPALTFRITDAPADSVLSSGHEVEKYWSPFPSVNAHPLTLTFTATADKPARVTLLITPNSIP